MPVALGPPHVIAFLHFAFVVDDAAFEHVGLFDLDMLVQRQHRTGLPAEERGQQPRLLVLEEHFHLDAGMAGRPPGKVGDVEVAGSERAERSGVHVGTSYRLVLIRYAFLAWMMLLEPAAAQTGPLAITHVTVIDATGAAPRPDVTVLVDEGRISAIDREARIPEKATVVQGAGKFLIPGLWDMHSHWGDERYLTLFIANGVTGVRVMWGFPRHLDQRRRIAEGSLVGPRLAIAGPIIDGPKPFWPDSIAAATADQGREAVRRTVKEGYDYVKVYSGLPREVFFAIADEAKKLGIPFVGHVPDRVRAAE